MTDKESPATPNTTNRPLSPHLLIYRQPITAVLSIAHRITGAALAFGTVLIVYWLWAAAYNPDAYQCLLTCSSSWLARWVLVAWSAAFYYHLLNGIRHLFWDVGNGFELDEATRSGWIVVFGTIFLTALTWYPIL